LRPGAGSLFATEDIPQAVEDPQVQQGMLESSNILPIIEMARMIDVHRKYDSVKNFVEREDDRLKKMVRDLARVA